MANLPVLTSASSREPAAPRATRAGRSGDGPSRCRPGADDAIRPVASVRSRFPPGPR